ncbi:NAD-dependent epimerase/dehydratase family protein [Desulfobacula sp.]|uniref:NAD-dependent epimerase/dehydratase family protein n=1 Tax=Desulfobacula sp. TaxID=2593537 RepID=UPI001EBA5E59|nr:GDP-mannose 4,6-dehydratase [Desulfobacula sp.]
MKVLITGGAGFIGSHLAEEYLKKGHDVYIIDDLSTGYIENIQYLEKIEDYKRRLFFYHKSIFDPETLLDLTGTCDRVFHLAAAVGVDYILKNTLTSIERNIHGTEAVLKMCGRFKKRVLITSTSEVYGKHLHAPLVEDDNIIYGPPSKFRWSYAASKLMDEFMALGWHRQNNLDVVVTRLFNTIGPRQTSSYGMVLPRFVNQALKNEPLTVYGDGNQTRTFTYVGDVVTALRRIMEQQSAVGQIFNIGGTREISILELAKLVVKVTGSTSEIKMIPYDQAYTRDFEDMQRRVPSIEKIQKYIEFNPVIELSDIIKELVQDPEIRL